ncbi:uncharacterized protein [Coffea arabica]|uniref:SWIM-type domain-containing protein n=1 Tax=Coffea arabica TaxID=13443 RepID=A0ABM4UYF7_COFAR
MLVNNLCESFNIHILEARDQPIISLLETIREYIMDRIQQRKAAMEKYKGPIGPLPTEIVDERVKRSTHWNPIWNAAVGYQLKGPKGDQYAIDLIKRHCTCKLWAVSGIPCCHAIAAIHRNNGNPYNEVEGCYSTDLFLKIYCNVLQPISGKILWPPFTMPILDPPLTVAQPGRPRKAQMRDITEGKNHGRKLRRRIVIHCRKCEKAGHMQLHTEKKGLLNLIK